MADFRKLLMAAQDAHRKYSPKISAILKLPGATAKEALLHLKNEIPWWGLVAQLEREAHLPASREIIRSRKKLLLSIWPEKAAPDTFSLPSAWKGFRPVEDQCAQWRKIFGSQFDFEDAIKAARKIKRCSFGDGLLVLPKLSYLARVTNAAFFSCPWDDDGEGKDLYARILRLFVGIAKREGVDLIQDDFIQDRFSEFNVRLAPSARVAWRGLESQFRGNAVLMTADSGAMYAGHSARYARTSAIASDLFPLDAVSAISILFLHPDRLSRDMHLGIDFPGTVFSYRGDKKFFEIMYQAFYDGKRHLGEYPADEPVQGFGPAVGQFV